MAKKPVKLKEWYKLDNAAKIFPGQNRSNWSNIFRFGVELNEKIDSGILEEAVRITLKRFPCFDVRIRRGLFWYYLEKNPNPAPPVNPDVNNPCRRVKWSENGRFLFRVYFYENRISVEFYHALTDAYGAAHFAMTLVAVYLRLTGKQIPDGGMVLDINEKASAEELEDAFPRFVDKRYPAKAERQKKFVYHYRGTRLPDHHVNVTTGYIPVDKIKEKAKEYGVTVTEFLAAVMLFSMYRIALREGKTDREVSVQVPVNLRNTFNTKTLRNFSLCYSVRINPQKGEYTFAEVLHAVSHYLKYINTEKELRAMINGNLGLENNLLARLMPLWLKNLGINIAFHITGEQSVSGMVSNVGILKCPEEMLPYVSRVMLMAGPGVINGSRCACVTWGNTLAVTLTNIYEQTDIQREFFTSLVKMKIPVKIESNRRNGHAETEG